MTSCFDIGIDRRGTDCVKWDLVEQNFGSNDVLPMWVADTDFPAPQAVIEAVQLRAQHGAYGYSRRPSTADQAVVDWVRKRHGWEIKPEWLVYTPGVVPALDFAVMAFSHPGDKVVVQSPVYYPFYSTVRNNGRRLVDNELVLTGDRYVMDLDDLTGKLDRRVKMIFLCSPQNPTGRVWTREELAELGHLCLRHNVLIVSDDIHSDVILRGHKHIPISSLSDDLAQNTITCISPSKTFNLAGLSTSVAIIPNAKLRAEYQHIIERFGFHASNIFGLVALDAAYRFGEGYVDDMNEYLQGNLEYLLQFCQQRLPKIRPVEPEGTFLVWLDCRNLGMDSQTLGAFMSREAKVGLSNGVIFGLSGEGFLRMNIGCPRSTLREGLERIERAINGLWGAASTGA